jgi:hypothetical protein
MHEFVSRLWLWVLANSNGLSIVLSLVGFAILIVQVTLTKRAASAAKEAALSAVSGVEGIETVSDLAQISMGFSKVQVALRGSRWEAALIEVQVIRERLQKLRKRGGFSDEEKSAEIQKMVLFLKKTQDSLERHIATSEEKPVVPKLNSGIADHSSTVAQWAEAVRFVKESST